MIFNRNAEIVGRYDKHHLVPFGEYMPFGLDTITGFSNFTSGDKPQLLRADNLDLNIMPSICYEGIFPRYAKNSTDNSVLINITNDAWFGNTAGPYQHFDHIVFEQLKQIQMSYASLEMD